VKPSLHRRIAAALEWLAAGLGVIWLLLLLVGLSAVSRTPARPSPAEIPGVVRLDGWAGPVLAAFLAVGIIRWLWDLRPEGPRQMTSLQRNQERG